MIAAAGLICLGSLAFLPLSGAQGVEILQREYAAVASEIRQARQALVRGPKLEETARLSGSARIRIERFATALERMSDEQLQAAFLKANPLDPGDDGKALAVLETRGRELRRLAMELEEAEQISQEDASADAKAYAEATGDLIDAAEAIVDAIMSLFGF